MVTAPAVIVSRPGLYRPGFIWFTGYSSGIPAKKDINDTFVIVHDFKRPIGEGCFNETGVRFFTMSRLCIVINRKPFNGKTFFIASFYPESNMDEIDIVNDVIDGFL